jgi:hypothetical protein
MYRRVSIEFAKDYLKLPYYDSSLYFHPTFDGKNNTVVIWINAS